MPRRLKRRERMQANPGRVRFEELRSLLNQAGFVESQKGTSHIVFRHPAGERVTIVRPHAGQQYVKPAYVREALAAVACTEAATP